VLVKLIVGLGNPGKEYATSRHNIGFLVINGFAETNGIALRGRKFKSRWGSGEISGNRVILAKPQTYMNLSGDAVSAIVHFYKIETRDIIVVHDDLDLSFGSLRIKTKGGSGGHNGINSIIASLNDGSFTRVRVGIGRPPSGGDNSEFVLSPFTSTELKELTHVIDEAHNCLGTLITHDPEFAMNLFNRKEAPQLRGSN
jgi:PTH1 family peptidyl-tRNA hydrolase